MSTRIPKAGDLVIFVSTLGNHFRAKVTRVFADDSEPNGEMEPTGALDENQQPVLVPVFAANGKARACSPCHLLVDVPADNRDPEFGTPEVDEIEAPPESVVLTEGGLPKRYFKPVPVERPYCSQSPSGEPEPGHFVYPTEGA
jgi:hypothetical protein